jgi:transposase-like protein
MSKFAQTGDFCPNKACADYGKLQSEHQHNIIRFGKTEAGRQRFKCKTCGDTFVETKGTIFYRRRTPAAEIIETLALIAEGSRISSLARVKGYKEDTIIAWIRDAAKHAEVIEEMLLAEYQIERGQLDGLWAYVRNKGEKKTTPKPTKAVSSGALP